MNFFPSKKIIALLASLLVLAAAGFLAASYKKTETVGPPLTAAGQNDVLSGALAEYLAKKDTDGDGLRDWEEDLWGTSSANPDSDGDGARDGEEVSRGRNPRVAGPGDELSATLPQESASGETLTGTDRLARNIFTDYLALKQSGNLTEEAQQELILSNLENTLGISDARVYTVSDVRLTSNSGANAMRAYGNEIGNILKRHSIQTENEAVIVLKALQEESEAELRSLDPLIASYEAMERELAMVPVPQAAATAHLSLMNGIAEIAAVDAQMRKVFSDPITGLAGVRRYLVTAEQVRDSFEKLDALFATEDIEFSDKEDGSVIRSILSFSL